ncbi:MAG: hypothetical protein GWN62_14680 [Aliifodinibius sp.]|nr:hypothetical protein [Fodinibius sp.]NIW79434.1 hypothetical protein [Calditrichia bacterium]
MIKQTPVYWLNRSFVLSLRQVFFSVICLSASLLLVACNGPETVDKPASELDVKIHVIDTDENPSDGKIPVVMQYFFDGKYVKLLNNVAVTCNGVTLTDEGLGYAARVPQEPTGGTYTFQHSRNGVNTSVSVTVPQRPVFVAPTVQGATIARTNNLIIHYVPGTGKSVRGNASDGTNSKNNNQDDDGTHEGMDVSGFTAGPGRLSITRNYEDPITGTGFNSVENKYSINKAIDITWQ